MGDPAIAISVVAHQDNVFEASRMMSDFGDRYVNHVQNIVNLRRRAALAQRADGKSVTAATIAVAEDDIACWTAKHQTIVTVVDYIVLE